MIPENSSIPPVNERMFREKANTYPPCFSARCPLREHCLHALVIPYIPQDRYVTTAINLCQPQAETESCEMYRSSEAVRMPLGLLHIYHDMPSRIERNIKNRLIFTYGRKRYYEYHNGKRPVTPDVEAYVRQVCLANGWTAELHFPDYVEEYLW